MSELSVQYASPPPHISNRASNPHPRPNPQHLVMPPPLGSPIQFQGLDDLSRYRLGLADPSALSPATGYQNVIPEMAYLNQTLPELPYVPTVRPLNRRRFTSLTHASGNENGTGRSLTEELLSVGHVDALINRVHRDGEPAKVGERLRPTLLHALREVERSSKMAHVTSYALNIAIGLQVIISAFITGVAAASGSSGARIGVAVMGGIGTIVASYLARARGSGEPETSVLRTSELEKYIRVCEAFIEDHGSEIPAEGSRVRKRLDELRDEFERLLNSEARERERNRASA